MVSTAKTTQSVANRAQKATPKVVRIVVPLFLPNGLDYYWNDATTAPTVGTIVDIQVGRKNVHGMVLEVLDSSPFQGLKPAAPIKNLHSAENKTVQFDQKTTDFYTFVARYNLAAPGDPLRAGLIKNSVPTLGKRGKIPVHALGDVLPTQLNEEQRIAADAILTAVGQQQKFQPFLLDGVTGSGKTEVYFDVIEKLLKCTPTAKGCAPPAVGYEDGVGLEGRKPLPQAENPVFGAAQILILVPEIALTPQWLIRFEARFGFKPVAWHSGLAAGARAAAWWGVHTGSARVVVGARSALFLPWQNLGLVVVDEEHDPSYKQSDVFRYQGRDMAVVLARYWGCAAVLASATPSLETYNNALMGKYTHLTLKQRHGDAVLPKVQLVDLRKADLPKTEFISPQLVKALEATLNRTEQALIFMNRRGTAPLLLCKSCGHKAGCPRCDANLTAHGTRIICHYCGYTDQQPDTCASCETEGEMALYGPGTRRIVSELQTKFPHARVGVADSDALNTPAQMKALMADMADGKIDILVGTQMVAKGHHFPRLSLVGVVDGDMGLALGDVRASERTFQLLTQVSGRAGRDKTSGTVLIQTFEPEHDLFTALKAGDRDGFYTQELGKRKDWGDPPFGRLVGLILSGKTEKDVAKAGQMLAAATPKQDGIRVLGPAPAPLAKLKDMYRYRLLVKGETALQKYVQTWLASAKIPRHVRVVIDVDAEYFG